MLEIRVSGDAHPKTFTLVTDDSDGELARLDDIFKEIEADPDEDELYKWFNDHTVEEFAQGVEIPQHLVGEFEEVAEGDWYMQAQKIDAERQDALRKVEEEMAASSGGEGAPGGEE